MMVQEYLDGRTKTLLGFELPPRIRRLLLHSSGSHFGMDDVNMSPLSSADSDHLLEVNSIPYFICSEVCH